MSSISVVITTLNEAGSITKLLNSLASQTKKPVEVVIVDGGSTDTTVKKITSWKKSHTNSNVVLIEQKGANRSVARNLGIDKAKSDIIAVTDAGCTPQKDWLKLIAKPIIKGKADSVAGFYTPITKTIFQKSLAPFVAVMPDKLNVKKFLPSSRSVAFSKQAWAKAGKYPENNRFSEDIIFAKNLKTKTKMLVEPKAIVHWQLANNLITYFHQIKNYATGDTQSRYTPHLIKIITVYFRYLIFVLLPPFFLIYLLFPIYKHYHRVNQPLGFFYLPLIQLTTDLAIIVGSLSAFTKSTKM